MKVETAVVPTESARVAVEWVDPFAHDLPMPQDKQVLLLINGYQRTRSDFRALQKRLASLLPHVVTVSLDNRGCGETVSESSDFSLDDMVKDAFAAGQFVAQKYGLSRFSVLGISMGGMIAQVLASQNSGAVVRLVLVSTTMGGPSRVFPADESESLVATTFRPWGTDVAAIEARLRRYFAPRFLRSSPLIFKGMVQGMSKMGAGAGQGALAKAQFHASVTFNGEAAVAGIECPTLVISGSEDGVIPLENSKILYKSLKNPSLRVYEEVGHLILVEEPQKLVEDLKGFLAPHLY